MAYSRTSRDAEFFEKMDEIFAKYCGNEPELFARFACGGLFAHLFDDGFFRRLEQVRDEVFKGVQGALVKAMSQFVLRRFSE